MREKQPFNDLTHSSMNETQQIRPLSSFNNKQALTSTTQKIVKLKDTSSQGSKQSQEKLQENIQVHLKDENFQGRHRQKANSKTWVQNSSQKSSQYQNYSDIKNKISMFSMQQLNSPSNQNSAVKDQNSNSNDKRYRSSGSDRDLQSGEKLRLQKTQTTSALQTAERALNLQDQMAKVQQKIQNFRVKSADKNAAVFKSGIKNQNVSLSILLEEDSNSQQLINTANDKLMSSQTYDGRTSRLTDQKYHAGGSNKNSQSNGPGNNSLQKITSQQNIQPVLNKTLSQQRSTGSLNSKYSLSHSNAPQTNSKSSSNANTTKNKIAPQTNLKNQALDQNKSQSSQYSSQISQHQKNTNGLSKNEVSKYPALQQKQSITQINQSKILEKATLPQRNEIRKPQQKLLHQKSVLRKSLNGKNQNEEDSKNHLNQDSSLSKLLMPVFSSERNFKVKTPIGGIRSQTPNLVSQNKGTQNYETPNGNLNESRAGLGTDLKRNYQSIQLDLPLSVVDMNLSQSKTFDLHINPDPLTMRDLEIINQNQFKLENEQEFQTTENTSNQVKNKISHVSAPSQSSGQFYHSKKLSNNSSSLIQSQRDNQLQAKGNIMIVDDDQSCSSGPVLSGSLSQRCLTLQSFTDQSLNQSNLNATCIGNQQLSKRSAASRLHGKRAESRLNNLVQTIQKYKEEQRGKSDSLQTTSLQKQNTLQPKSSKKSDSKIETNLKEAKSICVNQSLMNQYNNFENTTDLCNKLDKPISGAPTIEQSKVVSSNQSLISTQHFVKVKSKKISKDHSFTSTVELKDYNNKQSLINQQEALPISTDNRSSIDSSTELQDPIFGTYSSSSQLAGFQSEVAPQPSQSKDEAQSNQKKSRNFTNYQEYFSFSNIDREAEQQQNQQTTVNYHSEQQHTDKKFCNFSLEQRTESSQADLINQLEEEYQSREGNDFLGLGATGNYQDKESLDKFYIGNGSLGNGTLSLGNFTSRRIERNSTMVRITTFAQESQSSQSDSKENQPKAQFIDLTGDILDIISEYLPSSEMDSIPPSFVLCNSKLLRNYVNYKVENFSIQNEILIDQIAELKKELFDYFDQKLFKMSKGLSIIYHSNINSKEWFKLEELTREKQLLSDDTTLIRLYLLLLGLKPKMQNTEFNDQLISLISQNRNRLNQIFNPELHFTFGPQILCQVGSLLQTFSLENYILNYNKMESNGQLYPSRKIRTLQILAQIIYEALQFCKIVPNRIESDIRELERVIELYTSYQDKLNRMITQ